MSGSTPDFEAMSDEDFLNHATAAGVFDEAPQEMEEPAPALESDSGEVLESAPTDESSESEEERSEVDVGDVAEAFISSPAQTLESKLDAASKAEATPPKDPDLVPEEKSEAGEEVASGESQTTPKQPKEAAAPKAEKPEDEKPEDSVETPPDYEALYKQVMAPFKANGREFVPTSPEEATRLMQMGANYTKKMQGLAPRLKLLRMLDNNQLLDEDRINYLIDLHKGEKGAIQKLLHDGKIDPLDLDTSAAPSYKPGNHGVSDAQMAFHDALETVTQSPTGRETVKTINTDWDDVSKKALFAEPSLLSVFDTQRQNGIYDRITTEIERRRTLGDFQSVPFIDAYKIVGDDLHAQGKLVPKGGPSQAAPAQQVAQPQSAPAPQQQSQAQSTRSNRSRPAATREQVRAVSPAPGTSARVAPKSFDPLTMSDEEIMAVPTPF